MKHIVYTPGVWDLLHIGHLNLIRRAKLCGDYLIVGVCGDRANMDAKGSYPVINQYDRATLLSSIKYVDEVYIYDNLDQSAQLCMLNVDTFVVGEQFGNQGVVEHEHALHYCKKNDIEIKIIRRYAGVSTSKIKSDVNER